METSEVLGGVGRFFASVLDTLSVPARRLIEQTQPDGQLFAFLFVIFVYVAGVACIGILLTWCLWELAHWIDLDLGQFATRTGNLKSVRKTVHASFRISWFIRKTSRLFGRIGLAGSEPPDNTGKLQAVSTRQLHTLARASLMVPFGIWKVVWSARQILFSLPVLFVVLVSWWAVYRPTPEFWSGAGRFLSGLLNSVSSWNPLAWIPLAVLALGISATPRLRGALAWRSDSYKNAHSLLYGIAVRARRVHVGIDELVEAADHRYLYEIIPALVEGLSAGRATWDHQEGRPVVDDRKWHPHPIWAGQGWDACLDYASGRSWARGRVPTGDDILLDSVNALFDEFRAEIADSPDEQFVYRLCPDESVSLLRSLSRTTRSRPSGSNPHVVSGPEFRRTRERIPSLAIGANLEFFTSEGAAEFALRTLWDNERLYQEFHSLSAAAIPDDRLLEQLQKVIDGVADDYRRCLFWTCHLTEELACLVRAGTHVAQPSAWLQRLENLRTR